MENSRRRENRERQSAGRTGTEREEERDGWTDREITAACCVQETAHSIVLLS